MPRISRPVRSRLLRRVAPGVVRVLGRVLKGRTNRRGDTLDPQVEALLKLQGSSALEGVDMAARRKAMEVGCFLAAGRVPELPTVEGRIAGCRFRRYEIPGATHALVFLHGGGWAVGSLDSVDALCRRLALGSLRTVISIEYPLAPEHPWPEPVYAVAEVWNVLDRSRWEGVALGGDSAGGNLAAAVSRLVEGIELQFLLYPGLDATRSCASHAEFYDEGLILEGPSIDFYLSTYAPDARDPLASPLLADDVSGLPPAVVAVAGFDPLRDEGLAYAERLQQAGVEVRTFDYATLPHGFGNFDGLVASAADAMDELALALRP